MQPPLAVTLAGAVILSASAPVLADGHLDIVFPYGWIGHIERSGFPEPSGIVFHPGRGTLFVVSDEGHVLEMSTNGDVLQQKTIGGDLEGATVDPATGLLYLVVEGADKIVEIDPFELEVTREFPIERTLDGATVIGERGQGIEGLTFVPDADHPEGGVFYVANQSFTLDDPEDRSAVFEVVAPLKTDDTGDATAKIVRSITFGVVDLSGLYYDAPRDHLFVICDSPNLFLEVTREGEVVRYYALPGDNQEGITLDGEGNLYIAQDTGGVVKFGPAGTQP